MEVLFPGNIDKEGDGESRRYIVYRLNQTKLLGIIGKWFTSLDRKIATGGWMQGCKRFYCMGLLNKRPWAFMAEDVGNIR